MGASYDQTRNYFKNKQLSFEPVCLGRTRWLVSPVGFGGYRIQESEATHAEALRLALRSGCNLIDTSANYGDGGSERLVGRVLGELISAGELERGQVVVVSKAGYIQGENLAVARERAARGMPFAEVVEYDERCWHSIAPLFLEDQLTRSLRRLGLEQLDVLLLHNPEYFLKTSNDHGEYYRRIKAAFAYLESEVQRGRIQWYGVSSNSFPEPREAPEYTSLETLLELAQEVAGSKHHFGVVQFPLNLLEPGAALEPNNSGKTVARLALQSDLGTLINRPLNAFNGTRMVRLCEFPTHVGARVTESFRSALARSMELETRYPARQLVPASQVAWGHIIQQNYGRLNELLRWQEILKFQARPSRDEALDRLSAHAAESAEQGQVLRAWISDYREASDQLFSALTAMLESEAAIQSKALSAQLEEAAPLLRQSATLSQKAIRVCRSVEGVQVVLVGMRSPEYVKDALSLEEKLPLDQAIAAFQSVALPLS